MSRREITIYDQATDVEATVVVERDALPLATPAQTRIVALTLAVRNADGHPGLRGEHLRILEELGLALPTVAAATLAPVKTARKATAAVVSQEQRDFIAGRVPTPRDGTHQSKPAKKASAKKAPPAKKGKGTRTVYRTRPSNAVLVNRYRDANGFPPKMAELLDVPVNTVYAWLKTARRDGVIPPAGEGMPAARNEDEQPTGQDDTTHGTAEE